MVKNFSIFFLILCLIAFFFPCFDLFFFFLLFARVSYAYSAFFYSGISTENRTTHVLPSITTSLPSLTLTLTHTHSL